MIPKFRAWEKNMNAMIPVENIDFLAKQINTNSVWRMFHEIELMQSTGLKDKSGVEIYEGDILKTFSNINKYTDSFAKDIEPKFEYTTVVRDGACFKTTYEKRASYVLNENSGSMVEHMEVIGNIYENPELIGGNR